MSIEDFTIEFDQFMLKCELVEPEENTVTFYLGELKLSISNVMQLQLYWILLDVQILALKVEKDHMNIWTTLKQGSTLGLSSRSLPYEGVKSTQWEKSTPEERKVTRLPSEGIPRLILLNQLACKM